MSSDPSVWATERIDLHVHSTWSSGFCEPSELVRWASMADVHALAITDHHHIEAYREAHAIASSYGVQVIPGVELDCVVGDRAVDLLGYWFDPEDTALHDFLATWPSGLAQVLSDDVRARAIADATGLPYTRRRLRQIANGRPPNVVHAMLQLVELGWARTIGEAHVRYHELRQRVKLAASTRRYPTVEEAAAVIHSAGGAVVVAHPALVHDDFLVEQLVTARIADAVETPYGGYWRDGDEKNERYAALARRLDVPMSAGSDYHAYPFEEIKLGMHAPDGTLERLARVRRQREERRHD